MAVFMRASSSPVFRARSAEIRRSDETRRSSKPISWSHPRSVRIHAVRQAVAHLAALRVVDGDGRRVAAAEEVEQRLLRALHVAFDCAVRAHVLDRLLVVLADDRVRFAVGHDDECAVPGDVRRSQERHDGIAVHSRFADEREPARQAQLVQDADRLGDLLWIKDMEKPQILRRGDLAICERANGRSLQTQLLRSPWMATMRQ